MNQTSTSKGPNPRTALVLLLAINLFNYLDRQVLSAVLPEIESEFGCSKTELGFLTSIFLVSYMVAAPLFGWLGDRSPRWRLVAVGVILWSLASGGTGLAMSIGMMLLTRALIGVGEGAYGPVAPSLISDMYPVQKRGAKLAWFYVAIPVGSALGYVLGGHILQLWGWRYAFYAVVPPGVLLGLLCFLMREPVRGAADGREARPARWEEYLRLLRIRSYLLCSLGMTAMTFAFGGVAAWIPTYYYERESTFNFTPDSLQKMREVTDLETARVAQRLQSWQGQTIRGMDELRKQLAVVLTKPELAQFRVAIADATRTADSKGQLAQINTTFGGIVVLAGLAATLAGGWLGDRLKPRFPGSYFLVSGAGMLIGFPAFLGAVVAPMPWAWVCVLVAVFFLFFNTGPTNAILANVTDPAVRSTAFALNIFIIHLFGDVASPPLVGWIDDYSNLRDGMFVLSGALLLAGVFWLLGTRHLAGDTARVSG